MKKLSLKAKQLGNVQVLTREQLKNVLGGKALSSSGSDCPSGTYPCTCNGVSYGCKSLQGCWDSC
ncbi:MULTISPECIES: hypothetical protein [Olivibacter]|jgi:hypothetical protein|uniref:Natural product n=1 Tax=Olivibacter oleidegradans TaxID=760123 RepID=A0ABV6HSA4_9SPHI|nr:MULTISPECIES: hypothetical protein [unclassified Olivibacter]MCL4640444.1 hypothetical protein [Olivibacter sp. UJ_SKK_5.1]MDM8173695.1 hypothetical protein [Olivibacter sp. 47]MDX3914869.1 hypothetical protein [Pseudosphingobacterium sp.]QEL03488.1 hypothetical protein FKG96_22525 [Olivibacter sp. LS-1]